MPKKFKTKVNKKLFFRKKKFPRRGNNFRKKINYPNSTRVQTFGPGVFKINIEQQFVIDSNAAGLYQAKVSDYITDAVEFQQYAGRFSYYKVSEIGLTIYPNDDLKNLETGLGIDWFGNVYDAQGFQTWDSKKLIFNNNVRTKTFFFKPPNLMLEAGNNAGPWNFRNFNSTNVGLPGKVCVNIPGTTRVQGRIIARVIFKVPKPGFFDSKTHQKDNNLFKLVKNKEERLINIPRSKFGPAIFEDKNFKKRFKIEKYLEEKERRRENEPLNLNKILNNNKNKIKKNKHKNDLVLKAADLKIDNKNFEIKSENNSLNSSFISSYSVVSNKSSKIIDCKKGDPTIDKKHLVKFFKYRDWRTNGLRAFSLHDAGDGKPIPTKEKQKIIKKLLEIAVNNSPKDAKGLHFDKFKKLLEGQLKDVNYNLFDDVCWKMVFKDWDCFLKDEDVFSPTLQDWFEILTDTNPYYNGEMDEKENEEDPDLDDVDFNDDALYEDEKF